MVFVQELANFTKAKFHFTNLPGILVLPIKTKKIGAGLGQSDNTVSRAFALHMTNLDSIPSILYGLPSTIRSNS